LAAAIERQAIYAAKVELEDFAAAMKAAGASTAEVAGLVNTLTEIQQAEAAQRAKMQAEEAAQRARIAADELATIGRVRSETERTAREQGAGGALGTITSLRHYALSLTTTGAGAGTAMDRLGASQREFDAVFGAARAGDANSISGLQGAAEGFRATAREVYGGGQGYADALGLVEQRITAISNLGAEALTQSFVAENARENTDRIVDALAELRRENTALRRDLNLMMQRPAA